MGLSPGDVVECGHEIAYVSHAAGVDPGDAAALSNGEVTAATDSDTFAGVATADGLLLGGVVVANVDTDDADGATVEGVSLSLSSDAGELYRDYTLDTADDPVYDQPGPVTSLSAEGGSWQGMSVPDGYAVVHVNFHR